ncbi:IclR family transcriptional regulator [Alicyclobacillus dauci]|uniref:IclR family transcriptional regulator n=1 Tax=Alicyclobacillus dauci TaxID=1475485 RepID=A0ABY6Z560_9BACL|nr:IclR family transcriptional regulator [Alicyclobacillus dauci]WAH38022.1 IclR family transcriptional regulator [Alicyclobacillus dauci]
MDYHVPSVELAAKILKLLSRYKYKACSLTEIAAKLEMNKTTCLRVLRTLEREDFIRYDGETRKYSLGPYLIPLGNRASELVDLVSSAITELPTIAEQTGFTCVLVERLRNGKLIYIASAEPPREDVRITVSVGQQFPDIGAAFGRCFLAYDDEARWHELIAKGLPRYTDDTVVDGNVFLERLRDTRQLGYTVSHGELTPGFSSIAVPIFNKFGTVELVLAGLMVTSQISEEIETRTVRVLLDASERLSEWYGYQRRAPMERRV